MAILPRPPVLRQGRIRPEALGVIVEACRDADGVEPCGLLLGSLQGGDVRIEEAVWTPNEHPRPAEGFQIPAEAHADAARRARARGWEVVGSWHAHLASPPEPGQADVDGLHTFEAAAEALRALIVAGPGAGAAPVVRCYATRGKSVVEIPLKP